MHSIGANTQHNWQKMQFRSLGLWRVKGRGTHKKIYHWQARGWERRSVRVLFLLDVYLVVVHCTQSVNWLSQRFKSPNSIFFLSIAVLFTLVLSLLLASSSSCSDNHLLNAANNFFELHGSIITELGEEGEECRIWESKKKRRREQKCDTKAEF